MKSQGVAYELKTDTLSLPKNMDLSWRQRQRPATTVPAYVIRFMNEQSDKQGMGTIPSEELHLSVKLV
jgi:hypothetical protein